MKLTDAREAYYTFSGKLSDVVRQLDLAGVALIWLFALKADNGDITIPCALRWPLGLFVVSLASDIMQYLCATIAWGCFHRHKEKQGVADNVDIYAPKQLNWLPLFFFWLKTLLNLAGYAFIIMFIARMII